MNQMLVALRIARPAPCFLLLTSYVLLLTIPSLAQGPLDPPGAPAPTMKTLEQIEPRISITNVPYVISQPGSYMLAGNLTSANSGVVIATNDVTLDLMGFHLRGSGGAFNGIALAPPGTNALRNIVVRNGSVSGFQDGVRAGASIGAHFEQLTISGNLDHGIHFAAQTRGHVVTDCVIVENGDDGLYLYGAFGTGHADHHQIARTTVSRNGRHGVHLYAQFGGRANGNRFDQLIVSENAGSGVVLDGAGGQCNDNVFTASSITANDDHGVFLNSEAGACDGNEFSRLTVSGNGVGGGTTYGFYLNGENGSCQANTLEDSVIRANGTRGIVLLGQCSGNAFTKTTVGGHAEEGILFRTRGYENAGNEISSCRILENGSAGILMWADGGEMSANRIVHNTISGNQGGVRLDATDEGALSGHDVSHNAISRNGSVMATEGLRLFAGNARVTGNTIGHNTLSANGGFGIIMAASGGDPGGVVQGNLIEHNVLTRHIAYGIYADEILIDQAVTDNRIQHNLTADNEDGGIVLAGSQVRRNVLVHNQSHDGIVLNPSAITVNPHGPIVNHNALLGNSGEQAHPWANFAPVVD